MATGAGIWISLLISSVPGLSGQPAALPKASNANAIYQTVEGRKREAADMDHPKRPGAEETARLIRSFQIEPGTSVADIGTGVGYLLPYLAAAVGPRGKVFAEDIYPDLLEAAKHRIHEHHWSNVVPLLGTERDPNLPQSSVDLTVIVDTYHHFDYPGQMLAGIRTALRPGGRLSVADFYRYRPHPFTSAAVMMSHIRTDRDETVDEIQKCGFRLDFQFDHFSYEYVLVFRRAR